MLMLVALLIPVISSNTNIDHLSIIGRPPKESGGMRTCQCWKKNTPSAAAFVWLHLIFWLVTVVAAVAADQAMPIGLPGCWTSCGNVSVPYPFGIQPGCSLLEFNLTCDTNDTPPRLFFFNDTNRVTEINLDESTMLAWSGRGRPPSSRQLLNDDDDDQPIAQWGMTPGGFFLVDQPLLQTRWMLLSSVLQEPNETRAGNATCPKDLGTTTCHSTHSTCQATSTHVGPPVDVTVTGYTCRCDDGYQGNAYLSDGCQDIDECAIPDNKCFANCTNLPGKYLCECPKGTIGNPYATDGCIKWPNKGLIIGLGVGSGAMLLIVVIATTLVIHKIKIQRKRRMRERFFKQNRGRLLQQLISQRADIAERMIVTLEELEKATNNFDKARELGGGGHGVVYKGILSSLHVVAVKKSKIVIQKEIDEFINEVAILSQINHRNIVKLFGCCLETEVPLLVYEYISNGTLYNHLHVDNLISLSWRDRLRIAVETSKALAYLHSLASMPIIHRDVKSPNILLEDNLTVRLSDFGASRYVPMDQTGLNTTVQGTCGYLDPMYHRTGHLTEKSDVYSFGVLMIELLTRKKPVSYRSTEGHSLVFHFVTLLSEGNLFQILDPQVLKEGDGEVIDIALLAAICVKHISTERPTMRQVEMTLESIYAAKEFVSSDMTNDEWSSEDMIRVHDNQIDFQSPKELD